jgi:subtilase family protein
LTTFPNDPNGHGTHVAGTMVGQTVGVAPGAKWIACKGCDENARCPDESYKACGQFMFCPDLITCAGRPHIINNRYAHSPTPLPHPYSPNV